MTPEEFLREGRLPEAMTALQDKIRNDPSNAKLRIFLFQLLAIRGQWDRALTQLNLSAELDAAALAMAQMYREALQCEVLRAEVFAGRRTPLLLGEPQEWMGVLLESLRLSASGEQAAAQTLRDQAFEAAPATSGKIDDQPFAWLADADPRLGPVIEAIVNGRYYWVPVQQIRRIDIEEPADLRDLVWAPVHFTWANGGEMVGLIPTRYPGSETSDDGQVCLARKTLWAEAAGEACTGLGQRTLVTDTGDFPLLQIRVIELDTEDNSGESAEAAETESAHE